MEDTREDIDLYTVVINHEEQYSIWAAERPVPLGWNEAGKRGTKQECLAYIKHAWTDMRPLSLRRAMAEEHGPVTAKARKKTSRTPPSKTAKKKAGRK